MSNKPSRFWQFALMLPFFIIGVALPVFFHGFSGDGPPNLKAQTYSPVAPIAAPPRSPSYSDYRRTAPAASDPANRSALVGVFRGFFDGFVDRFVSTNLSPTAIKTLVFCTYFLATLLLIRLALVLTAGVLAGVMLFLVHMAIVPLFVGFLAVGSSWGIHQTMALQFGINWLAAAASLMAGLASLISLAGVRVR